MSEKVTAMIECTLWRKSSAFPPLLRLLPLLALLLPLLRRRPLSTWS